MLYTLKILIFLIIAFATIFFTQLTSCNTSQSREPKKYSVSNLPAIANSSNSDTLANNCGTQLSMHRLSIVEMDSLSKLVPETKKPIKLGVLKDSLNNFYTVYIHYYSITLANSTRGVSYLIFKGSNRVYKYRTNLSYELPCAVDTLTNSLVFHCLEGMYCIQKLESIVSVFCLPSGCYSDEEDQGE